MRLAIISDLHLEFRDVHEFYELIKKVNATDADHVLNAGDLSPNKTMRDFFHSGINIPFSYVAGNHDYYGSRLEDDHYSRTLPGSLKLSAATLWTDFKNKDPLVMMAFRQIMSDGKLIKRNGTASVEDEMYAIHMNHISYIRAKKPDVVMTHHGPSFQSVHEAYKHDYPSNYYYYSDYDEFIEDSPHIKLWIHGHSHTKKDYTIGSTRVICHPLGYPTEQSVADYDPLIVEV